MTVERASGRTLDVVGALCLAAVAVLYSLGLSRPFGNGDEVVYAQSLREMLSTGDFTTLRWHGVDMMQRPPTPFILSAPLALLLSGEVGMRLSSLLWCMATLLLVYRHLKRYSGRAEVAATAVLLCAGIPTFVAYDHLLMSDPPFVFGCTLAAVALLRAVEEPAQLRWVGAGLGWAVACKSLAAAVPAVALALPALWVVRRHRAYRLAGQAVAIGLALALPYYVMGLAVYGARFWQEHVVYSLWRRATGDIGVGSAGGPGFYLRWLWEVDGPAVVAWLLGGSLGALALGLAGRRPALVAVGALPPAMLLLYSLVASRLPHYLLPALPVWALSAGYVLAEVADRRPGSARLIRVAAPAVAATLLLLGLGNERVEALLIYDDAAVELGKLAGAHAGPDEPIYVHEWYAPAVAYYADRPLRLSTAMPDRLEQLRAVDFFEAAGVPVPVPPAPLAQGTPMLVAGPVAVLQRATWLRVEALLGRAGPHVLVRATARQTSTQ